LAERGGDAQARAEDEVLPVVLKLRGGQRRGADEVYRETKRRVGEARDITLARQAEGDAFRREPYVWDDHIELRRLAEHVERCGISEDSEMRFVAHVVERQRRIGEHAALRIAISDDGKIEAGR
jgi:hypothetical protein